ncbi:MAG: hypothetical protein NC915_03940 [Candidatus Omnitrophica bacterium]|nr:hypothetical protein [Candidatus Omnitrophota bacterium]
MIKKFLLLCILIFISGCDRKDDVGERNWRAKVKLGDYHFSNKNIDMALKYWIESLDFKKDPLTYEKIVTSFIVKKEFNEGKKYAISGLTYFKNNDNLLFNLGLIEFILEEYDESMEILDRLLERNKYYPEAHYLKGLIYEKKGQIEKAKKEFIEEVNINPGSKKAWKKIKEMKNEN